MSLHTAARLLALTLLTTTTTAQLLTNGNTQLPSCASACPLLAQAAQACGGTTAATQAIWSCFCQSGYLTSLYNSPAGICDAVCTSASDNQKVMTWFTSNCGRDDGAAEHAAAGSDGGGTTVVVVTSTSTSAIATGTGAVLPSTTASGGTVEPDVHTSSGRTWWDLHWKWVLMLLVLFAALVLLALLATCLKRRHDRRADQVREGFNAGITTRSTGTAPMSVVPASANTTIADMSALGPSGSGRNSPARTREAFMPYGYAYTRSESRLAAAAAADAHGAVGPGWRSPLARGGTPVGELEKEVGFQGSEGAPRGKKTRRVLVRERSVCGDGDGDGDGVESPEGRM
ncbi:hypothetical protein LTR01_007477 [Friedmanniomyces endolithicus]|nr:hypothetical protein LTR01_007477 [Friedmanniomyces endolithicus]KAK0833609.1 hypothetical protein LTR73_001372 [Friedmanniomyces endolithicus]